MLASRLGASMLHLLHQRVSGRPGPAAQPFTILRGWALYSGSLLWQGRGANTHAGGGADGTRALRRALIQDSLGRGGGCVSLNGILRAFAQTHVSRMTLNELYEYEQVLSADDALLARWLDQPDTTPAWVACNSTFQLLQQFSGYWCGEGRYGVLSNPRASRHGRPPARLPCRRLCAVVWCMHAHTVLQVHLIYKIDDPICCLVRCLLPSRPPPSSLCS